MGKKIRVLCLDIEGGYGGSSRSLYLSLSNIDPNDADITVWCKKSGPIQEKYNVHGIPVQIAPKMPRATSLPRLSRNLYVYGFFVRDWLKSSQFRKELIAATDLVDVVHFNHESLFLIAAWLKKRTKTPLSMHIRTNRYGTPFCRWQARTIVRNLDSLIFITHNERETLAQLSGMPVNGKVIYNIAAKIDSEPSPKVPSNKVFKIASLSNFALVRGTDRLIDIAKALKTHGRNDILFVVAGNMKLTRSLPGLLGDIGAKGGTLSDYVDLCGLSEMFLFVGHVSDPERVLAACDVLIKPTREANPWGRDILEGLAAGKPVISIGKYSKFVEDGVTGVLHQNFDANDMAAQILVLADDKARRDKFGLAGQERVMKLCDAKARAKDLLETWQELAANQ